jgi:methylenetetrahydrofolate reductase (NADPH)
MTKIGELLSRGTTLSFEFFPPRTPEAERTLEKTLLDLEPLGPSFVSVTYGAGGSTRDKTREIVLHIAADTTMTPMPHLTCIGQTRAEVVDIVRGYRDRGLSNILALAGDPPGAGDERPSDFRYASELIELVRGQGDFCVGVAAHPELHPRSPDRDSDRRHLAAKLREADFAITQFFFKSEAYFRMLDELEALGVSKPVIPGVIPVTNVSQVERFAALAGAEFPPDLAARLYEVADRPDEVRRVGVDVATQLARELLDGGVPGVHLYTLNFSRATREIWSNLGLGPQGPPRAGR